MSWPLNAARRDSSLLALLASLAAAALVLALGPASASATQNPIAAYSLDEASGEVVHDLYGNHDGEIENGATENDLPEWSQGKYGSALWFEGKGYQCVTVPHSPDLELTGDFTIETWVKPDGSGEQEPLIVKEAPTFESHTAYMLYLGLEETGEIGGYVEEPGWERPEVTSQKLPIGKWSHLAFSFDGESLRLYVNGALVDTSAAQGAQPSKGPLKFACAEVFGHDYKGSLDEVRIYDRALSGEEVGTDMNTALQTPPVSQQPVAAYSFDQGEGTIAKDLAGERDATIEGATWSNHGRYGKALDFDGVDDVVSIPASPGLHVEEEFTLEAWVRPSGENKYAPLITKTTSGSEVEPYFLYEGGWKSNLPYGGLEGNTPSETYSSANGTTGQIPENAWTHLALSFDGSKTRLYVDGVLVDEDAGSAPAFSKGAIEIGGSSEQSPDNHYFQGRIDEVRIYNRALDAGEIANDRGTGLETAPTGPVAAFAFEEGEGSTAVDTTGNGHTATLEGPSWTRGRYGSGLEFSATQKDAVTIAASPELDFSEELTLEAWVRPSDKENKWAPLIVHQTTGSEVEPYFLFEGASQSNLPYGGLEGETEAETFSIADDPLPQSAWSHVALTFDGSKTRLYVDGKLVDEDAGTPPQVSKGKLQIGAATEDGLDEYFDGRIDEVRLYDRALSEAEVQADRSTPIQTPQQGPVAAYSFDAGEGSTVEDLTGAGHTGQVAGAEWARGKYGNSLEPRICSSPKILRLRPGSGRSASGKKPCR